MRSGGYHEGDHGIIPMIFVMTCLCQAFSTHISVSLTRKPCVVMIIIIAVQDREGWPKDCTKATARRLLPVQPEDCTKATARRATARRLWQAQPEDRRRLWEPPKAVAVAGAARRLFEGCAATARRLWQARRLCQSHSPKPQPEGCGR